jgi:hypothetical protein
MGTPSSRKARQVRSASRSTSQRRAQTRALQGRGGLEPIEIREGSEDQHAAPQNAPRERVDQSPASRTSNRVERLERQYHRIRSELTTEKVVLVDADGKTRATLRMSEGAPGLILYDNDENVCAILRVSDEGPPALHLVHSKTKAGLELKVSDSGPDVSLFDASGKERLRLGVTTYASGTPYLGMLDPNGMQTLMVASLDNGPSINLSDPANADGNTVVRLQVDGDGPLLMCLKDGKFLWSAPSVNQLAPNKGIRVENALQDESDNEMALKEDSKVEVTIEADPEAIKPKK